MSICKKSTQEKEDKKLSEEDEDLEKMINEVTVKILEVKHLNFNDAILLALERTKTEPIIMTKFVNAIF
jgi:hypothetical protein